MRRASAFIESMVPRTPLSPPATRASTLAASLPELSSRPSHSVSTEYLPPSSRPTAELPGSKSRSSAVTVMTSFGLSFGSAVSASKSFCVLAGAPYSCGPHAPRTAPVSRSATSQYFALRFFGIGGAPGGTIKPLVASAGPPTAFGRLGSRLGIGEGLTGGFTLTRGQGTCVAGVAGAVGEGARTEGRARGEVARAALIRVDVKRIASTVAG